jgi:hypothetical protein
MPEAEVDSLVMEAYISSSDTIERPGSISSRIPYAPLSPVCPCVTSTSGASSPSLADVELIGAQR